MPISASELKSYKSQTVSDAAANGGRMGILADLITSAIKNNVWPNITQAERAAGLTRYRKVFLKVENDDDLQFLDSKLFVETFTPGADKVYIFLGTQRNTQGDLTGSERVYGAGQLASDIIVGASTLDVTTEDGADLCFANGDLVRVSDKDDVNDAGGNEEYLRLADPGGVSYAGDVATLVFDTGVTTAYAYLAVDTKVASVIENGTVEATFDNKTTSSASGSYDDTGNPIELDNIGTVEETITITFTSPTTFDAVGDTLGALGSGNITTDFAPVNSEFSKPYFTLRSAGWGGTWAISDTLSFQIHPSAVPVWRKMVVPAGSASYSNNKIIVAADGESA